MNKPHRLNSNCRSENRQPDHNRAKTIYVILFRVIRSFAGIFQPEKEWIAAVIRRQMIFRFFIRNGRPC